MRWPPLGRGERAPVNVAMWWVVAVVLLCLTLVQGTRFGMGGLTKILSVRGGGKKESSKGDGKVEGVCIDLGDLQLRGSVEEWTCRDLQRARQSHHPIVCGMVIGRHEVGGGCCQESSGIDTPILYLMKRLIGRKFSDPSVQKDAKLLPYKLAMASGDKPVVDVDVGGGKGRISLQRK